MRFPVAQRWLFLWWRKCSFLQVAIYAVLTLHVWTTKNLERPDQWCELLPSARRALADRITDGIRKRQRTPESRGEQPFPGMRTCNAVVFPADWTEGLRDFFLCRMLGLHAATPAPPQALAPFLPPSPRLQVFSPPKWWSSSRGHQIRFSRSEAHAVGRGRRFWDAWERGHFGAMLSCPHAW